MGVETSRVDGPATQVERLEDVANSRTDDGPGSIERRVEDTANGLDREVGVSARRLGERGGLVVGALDQDGMVAVCSDAVVVSLCLVVVRNVRGSGGRLARQREGTDVGHLGRRW